jgi:hypothetical protein
MRKQWIPKPADPLQDQINAILAIKLASKPAKREDRGMDRLVKLIERVSI